MFKKFLIAGGIYAMLSVILGAFGAHGLEGKISPSLLDAYNTGVRYQFFHALSILVLVFGESRLNTRLLKGALWCFTLGVVLFSGSLYLLSCRHLLGIESWGWLGPLTPIGGMMFILGWGLFIFSALKPGTQTD